MNTEVTSAHGDYHKYVVNKLMAPQARTDYAIDLNGDGKADNQLGNIIGALTSQGLDAQAGIDDAVVGVKCTTATVMMDCPTSMVCNTNGYCKDSGGSVIVLISVQTADATVKQDDQVGVTMYVGVAMKNPNFSGTGMFTVDTSQGSGVFYGKLNAGTMKSNDPITTKNPVKVTLNLPLIAGADPVALKLNGAHVKFVGAADKLISGELHGSIKDSDVQGNIIPAVARLLSDRVAADPNSDSSKQIKTIFDVGDGNGAACTNKDMTKSAPMDGLIGICEVAMNQIISNVLAPDVQIFDTDGVTYAPNKLNTKKDSLSLGVGFEAVSAVFTP